MRYGQMKPILISSSTHNIKKNQKFSRLMVLVNCFLVSFYFSVPSGTKRFHPNKGAEQITQFRTRSEAKAKRAVSRVNLWGDMGRTMQMYRSIAISITTCNCMVPDTDEFDEIPIFQFEKMELQVMPIFISTSTSGYIRCDYFIGIN